MVKKPLQIPMSYGKKLRYHHVIVETAGLLWCFQISIEPHDAGTFTAQLQVYSFPVVCEVPPAAHSLGPVLALEVVAEEPRVEVC